MYGLSREEWIKMLIKEYEENGDLNDFTYLRLQDNLRDSQSTSPMFSIDWGSYNDEDFIF
jgi:hypothetical protein